MRELSLFPCHPSLSRHAKCACIIRKCLVLSPTVLTELHVSFYVLCAVCYVLWTNLFNVSCPHPKCKMVSKYENDIRCQKNKIVTTLGESVNQCTVSAFSSLLFAGSNLYMLFSFFLSLISVLISDQIRLIFQLQFTRKPMVDAWRSLPIICCRFQLKHFQT